MSRPAAIAILTLMAACHGSEDFYAKPTAEKFEKMTDDERCDAVFPRAEPCLDALTVASAAQIVDDPEFAGKLGSAFHDAPPSNAKERRAIHRVQCFDKSREDAGYAKAVLACWDQVGCKALAACVYPPMAKKP